MFPIKYIHLILVILGLNQAVCQDLNGKWYLRDVNFKEHDHQEFMQLLN